MTSTIAEFKGITDGRGVLVSLEGGKNVPFEIKRVYYLYDLKKAVPRGFHAHRKLKQLVVCVSGSCDFVVDDGQQRVTHRLERPTQGILVDHLVWREMREFSDDCVLMVLASEHYDEDDYIRDYDTFKRALHDPSA
jgi:dTDP-4-dehydrorhamnose 3,5-epimerase-like enzyme